MAFVSLRQVLDHAAENGYGVPAFNVNNLEQPQASARHALRPLAALARGQKSSRLNSMRWRRATPES